jgi:hypothetical protein
VAQVAVVEVLVIVNQGQAVKVFILAQHIWIKPVKDMTVV